MRFGSIRIAEEYKHICPALRGILEDAQDFCSSLFQWDLFLTCLIRTPKENDECYGGKGDHLTGVHVDGRGADIRVRDVDPESVDGLVGYLNERFVYDPDRPTMRVAFREAKGVGSTGAHVHVQTHANTRNRYVAEDIA